MMKNCTITGATPTLEGLHPRAVAGVLENRPILILLRPAIVIAELFAHLWV